MTVEWSATEDRVCGFGERGVVSLAVEGWQPGGRPPALSESVDAVAAGTTAAIGVPSDETALVTGPERGRPVRGGELGEGLHRLDVPGDPRAHIAFEGPATVEGPATIEGPTVVDDPANVESSTRRWIRFAEPRPVAVGFREERPERPTVRVPATPAGLATAVTAAGRTHRTDGPERSHPGYRPRTPRVQFGGRSVPDDLAGGGGPTMTVPESTVAVLVAAPLAYYLGASLRIEPGPPVLRAGGFDHEFESLPAFADGAADALRRLLHLDARLRSVPGETGPTTANLDTGELVGAPPARRLAAALERPTEPLPEWPLATYVDEAVRNGLYLPYVLDRLGLVFPASASSLDPQALLKRSLTEFYRGETPNVEAVDPTLADSQFHGWRGEGTPVDAYTLIGSPTPRTSFDEQLRIDVVCNDRDMDAECDVADVYRRQLEGADVDVRVHGPLARAELAEVFEHRTDLVHFIGHCEVDGMVCFDGVLAAADLEECGAEAFFLNACGSYYEGFDLVRRGATVGAVTLSAVLDEQAVTVGTAFARLLSAGFAFDRALSLARGEIIVGRDYAVVGDGSHGLRPPYGTPGVFELERDGDTFRLTFDAMAPDAAGRRYLDPTGSEHLCGETAACALHADAVVRLLERFSLPVRYRGDLRWSDELAEHIEPIGQ